MKTNCSSVLRLLFGTIRAAALVGAFFSASAFAQVVVDPDPEIFDGTRTKKDTQENQPEVKIDDWEGPNLIVYDEDNVKGSEKGGAGRQGFGNPGMDIGEGGGGTMPGLPFPMGGGGGDSDKQGMQIPTGQNSVEGAGQTAASTAGAAESMAKPGNVQIGDDSQRIATTAQGQAGNVAGRPEGGVQGSQEVGEDATKVDKGAAGQQSGKRGGGVEQGDAMPSEI